MKRPEELLTFLDTLCFAETPGSGSPRTMHPVDLTAGILSEECISGPHRAIWSDGREEGLQIVGRELYPQARWLTPNEKEAANGEENR